MLEALQEGSAADVGVTLAHLDKFVPAGSNTSESERRDLLEALGAEMISGRGANETCRALLKHLAGPEGPKLMVQ